jgi:Mg2+/Co2+ transporter CorB
LIDIPMSFLLMGLVLLIILSAFFSGSETAMMALNRYRLRHLVKQKIRGAMRVNQLLERPDRLIGVILLGANFVQTLASSLATVIALEIFGEKGIAIAAGAMTLIMLIFAELTPKTLGALHPERIAFPSALLLTPLLKILYPIVWIINGLTSMILSCFGIRIGDATSVSLSREELRSVVQEASTIIPNKHQQMLLSILELENVTVEDVMVYRQDIDGIDLTEELASITEQLSNCRHTRIPVYHGTIDDFVGFLHTRQIPRLYRSNERISAADLETVLNEPYYIPAGTPIHTQLVNFQAHKKRMGLVVDEYGEILGLVTLEDILEEIVGEFTTAPLSTFSRDIHPEADGSYLFDGAISIREVNRSLGWQLPVDTAKTLNGVILEALEDIPETGISLRIDEYTIEIVQTSGQSVKTARITPPGNRHP